MIDSATIAAGLRCCKDSGMTFTAAWLHVVGAVPPHGSRGESAEHFAWRMFRDAYNDEGAACALTREGDDQETYGPRASGKSRRAAA